MNYLNVTTHEERKLTVQLSSLGFRVVCDGKHDTAEELLTAQPTTNFLDRKVNEVKDPIYFETPYALLSSVSAGYDKSFGDDLISKLSNIQN